MNVRELSKIDISGCPCRAGTRSAHSGAFLDCRDHAFSVQDINVRVESWTNENVRPSCGRPFSVLRSGVAPTAHVISILQSPIASACECDRAAPWGLALALSARDTGSPLSYRRSHHAAERVLHPHRSELQGSRPSRKRHGADGRQAHRPHARPHGDAHVPRAGGLRRHRPALAGNQRDQHRLDAGRGVPRVRHAGRLRDARGRLRAVARVDQHPRRRHRRHLHLRRHVLGVGLRLHVRAGQRLHRHAPASS